VNRVVPLPQGRRLSPLRTHAPPSLRSLHQSPPNPDGAAFFPRPASWSFSLFSLAMFVGPPFPGGPFWISFFSDVGRPSCLLVDLFFLFFGQRESFFFRGPWLFPFLWGLSRWTGPPFPHEHGFFFGAFLCFFSIRGRGGSRVYEDPFPLPRTAKQNFFFFLGTRPDPSLFLFFDSGPTSTINRPPAFGINDWTSLFPGGGPFPPHSSPPRRGDFPPPKHHPFFFLHRFSHPFLCTYPRGTSAAPHNHRLGTGSRLFFRVCCALFPPYKKGFPCELFFPRSRCLLTNFFPPHDFQS